MITSLFMAIISHVRGLQITFTSLSVIPHLFIHIQQLLYPGQDHGGFGAYSKNTGVELCIAGHGLLTFTHLFTTRTFQSHQSTYWHLCERWLEAKETKETHSSSRFPCAPYMEYIWDIASILIHVSLLIWQALLVLQITLGLLISH